MAQPLDKKTDLLCLASKRTGVSMDKIRAILVLWSCTVSVMWLYVLFSYFSFGKNSPVVSGGILCACIHSLAPIVFLRSKSMVVTGVLISFSGLAFQSLFCVYSGGIYSPAAIWLSLHPVILAFFANVIVIIVAVMVNASVIFGMYAAQIYGYLPDNNLALTNRDLMSVSTYIGLDILIALFSIVTIVVNQRNQKIILGKKEVIENLVRILSHDIINPLTISKVQSQLFKKGKISEQQAFAKIDLANRQIFEIVNSVRYWMAQEEGKLRLKHEAIYCSHIVDHIESSFSERFANKNLSFKVNNQLHAEQQLFGDKSAILFQIINNVISNAIKFGPKDSSIRLDMLKKDDFIIFEIRDHGLGVDPALKSKIFSPYVKTSQKGTEGEIGTGFGMPIVKTLMDKMEGSVSIDNWYESKKKMGAVVRLKFPDRLPNGQVSANACLTGPLQKVS